MTTYILKRLLALVFVLLGISIIVFFLLQMVPGDPALALLGPMATLLIVVLPKHKDSP